MSVFTYDAVNMHPVTLVPSHTNERTGTTVENAKAFAINVEGTCDTLEIDKVLPYGAKLAIQRAMPVEIGGRFNNVTYVIHGDQIQPQSHENVVVDYRVKTTVDALKALRVLDHSISIIRFDQGVDPPLEEPQAGYHKYYHWPPQP